MEKTFKVIFALTMSLALAFGFLHVFISDFAYDFDRLHIFLFNLCAGGSILLYFGLNRAKISARIITYFVLSLIYALTAFLNLFLWTLILSIPLLALVESVRIKRFSFFPIEFFKATSISDKFLQASLLCLSMGVGIASLVILNNEYLHLITLEKLTIDVFFLGYSFPLSLLTFSVMFAYIKDNKNRSFKILKEISFWSITLGVIFFFLFIIFELLIAEVIISNLLLIAVLMTYYLFLKHSENIQQRWILSSGMLFLIVTGLTGVLYLFEYFYPELEHYHEVLLMLHATVALYGWNLSGLFVVVRWSDFPIFKRVKFLIALHWLTVLVLAPLGKYYAIFALIALPAYVVLVFSVFFKKTKNKA